MGLFQGIKLVPDFECLKSAKTWLGCINEFTGTLLWILIAKQISNSFSWGIAFVVVSLAIPGSGFNTLNHFIGFLNGSSDILQLILAFVFHSLGAIVGQYIAGFEWLKFTADTVEPILKFTGDGGAFSATFYQFFFSGEFVGIFLFTVLSARCQKPEGIPSCILTILLVSLAFWMGGDKFCFLPARCFNTFKSFAGASNWATLVCQLWSALAGHLVLEFVWTE